VIDNKPLKKRQNAYPDEYLIRWDLAARAGNFRLFLSYPVWRQALGRILGIPKTN
jgi:hypothetical protein